MTHLEAETSFGLSLLNHCPSSQCPSNQSMILSPLSIAFALAMVHLGAKGNTKQQINDAILKGANDEQLLDHYQFMSASFLNASNGIQTKLANRMFIMDGFPIKKDYLSAITSKYNAGAENLDFSNKEQSAKIVNGYVNKVTNGKISQIVEPNEFRDAVAFLINALYFKADWKDNFHSSLTINDTFHSSEDQPREVEFMTDFKKHRNYFENDEVQVLSLPYADSKYAFNVFLPTEKFGLSKFLRGLTAAKMQTMLGSLKRSYISFSLPKFKIEKTLELECTLQAIGVTEIFSIKADLSGITKIPIMVSKVTHKAFVEIDEKGTTAAAVTVVRMELRKKEYFGEPKEFKADHPFLFTITLDNHPLFIGTHY